MTIAYFIPPSLPADESARTRAASDSGLIQAAASLGLNDILIEAMRTIGARSAAVSVLVDDCVHVVAAIGFPLGIMRRSTSFSGHAILQGDPVFVVPDALEDERFAGNPIVSEQKVLRFFAGALLRPEGRHAIGTLSVFDAEPRAGLTDAETAALIALGDAVVTRLVERSFPPAIATRSA